MLKISRPEEAAEMLAMHKIHGLRVLWLPFTGGWSITLRRRYHSLIYHFGRPPK